MKDTNSLYCSCCLFEYGFMLGVAASASPYLFHGELKRLLPFLLTSITMSEQCTMDTKEFFTCHNQTTKTLKRKEKRTQCDVDEANRQIVQLRMLLRARNDQQSGSTILLIMQDRNNHTQQSTHSLIMVPFPKPSFNETLPISIPNTMLTQHYHSCLS